MSISNEELLDEVKKILKSQKNKWYFLERIVIPILLAVIALTTFIVGHQLSKSQEKRLKNESDFKQDLLLTQEKRIERESKDRIVMSLVNLFWDEMNKEVVNGQQKMHFQNIEKLLEVLSRYSSDSDLVDTVSEMISANIKSKIKSKIDDIVKTSINKELLRAADLGYFDRVKYLIEKKGADINFQDDIGISALYAASGTMKGVAIVKYLLENGAKPNLKIKESYQEGKYFQWTALKFATYQYNVTTGQEKEKFQEIINLLKRNGGEIY